MRSFRVAFFLTVRSIARGNIGVTVLTIAMLILANLTLLFVPSLLNGLIGTANEKLIHTYSGNIIIEAKGDNPLINKVDQLVERIEMVDGVTGVTYRNSMGAELVYEDERTNCSVRGVSPEREREVFRIADAIFEGDYLEARDRDKILLGMQLAGSDRHDIEFYSGSLKSVHAGDKISINYSNGVSKQYEVKGVFYTEFIQTDLQAFVTEREFKSVSPVANNQATSIHLKIRNDNDASYIIEQIAQFRDDLKFKTWEDMAGIVQSMTDSFFIINGILTIVNLLVAGITIFIVTYVDLVNKRRQIGIERAIGITPLSITMSYLLRAMFYAIVASVAAWLLYTYAVVPLVARYPFHFPFGDVVLLVNRPLLIRSAVVIFVVALVAAFLPTRGTIRMKLLDAIWG